MTQKDPLTLDLFNNTSLSSGLGIGVTAFAASFEVKTRIRPHPPRPPSLQ